MWRVQDFGPAPLDEPDAYPGRWPRETVLVEGSTVTPVGAEEARAMQVDRTPVLAFGSEACPAELARLGLPGPVLLAPTVLRNHLVVWAGHLTSAGAVAATIARWPGATASVQALWLTKAQHAVLHPGGRTIGGPDRVELPVEEGMMTAYRPRSGFTTGRRRQLVRVADVVCTGHGLPPAMTQAEVRLHRQAVAG